MRIAKGPPLARGTKSSVVPSRERAESLALQALTFLAEEHERIHGFLQLTGLEVAELPGRISEPEFLLAVLDHLASSEILLLDFAHGLNLQPEMVGHARRALGGGDAD
jgi:hypothetical protein